jgi:hypothetical protein
MESFLNIYYLLMSELATRSILYELVLEKSNAGMRARGYFTRITDLKSHINIVGQKTKIPSSDANTFYYFYITDNGIFIFLETARSFPQVQATKLIDEIIQQNVHFMTNDNGELNKNGKNIIKGLIAQYQEGITGVDELDSQVVMNERLNQIRVLDTKATFKM